MSIRDNTPNYASMDKTDPSKIEFTTFKDAGLPYASARFGKERNDYPQVRSDMSEALKRVRAGIKSNPSYPKNADFIITSGYRPGANGGGHRYGTGVDIQPTGGLTYSQLADAIKKYGDGLDGIPHLNAVNGNTLGGAKLPKDLDKLPKAQISKYHLDLKYIKPYEPKKYIDPNAKTPSLAKDPYIEQSKNKPSGTQNPYAHPEVNYDPTQRIYNRNGQILKQASIQGNQPPVASKPFGRQPVFQSPNNAAIGATLGNAAGAGVAVTAVGHALYQEAAAGALKGGVHATTTITGEIVKGTGRATGYAASIQGASVWSTATNAVSSAWSAATAAIGNVVSWIGGAISTMASAMASATVAVAGVIATAVTAAASAVGSAIMSAIAWIAALAFPW